MTDVTSPNFNHNTFFIAYPNPTKNWIHITSNENIKNISIIDLTGKIIFEQNIEDNKNFVSINVSYLDKGIYFLYINQKNFRTYPFLKE